MRIGLVGYGRMGAAMAARIGALGHERVVWNRSATGVQAAAEAGATIASSPAALAGQCDVVLSSLFDEAAVRAVYLGPDGLAHGALDGRLVIDTSTVPPEMGAVLADAIASAGGRFVDSPVVGTIGPAREGRLVALCGGAAADIAAARETLALVSRAIHPMGPSGAGYAGKLAVNLLKATYWAALGDCLGLGRRYGIEPDAILDVIESGPGALVELPAKMPILRGARPKAAFDIVGVVKDLGIMVQAGGGADAVPVAAGALEAARRAMEAGWGERDVAAVALFAAAQIAAGEAGQGAHPNSPREPATA